jgi:uncharacterized protein (DUF169 family)
MNEPLQQPAPAFDYAALADGLNRYLKLRWTPVGMKRYATRAEMEAIPKIRRPAHKHTLDQVVGQSRHLGWTLGVTYDDLSGAQCGTPVGLHPRDAEWLSGKLMAGVWYADQENAAAHQAAMDCAPSGRFEALAVSPLTSGRLDPPEICLVYGTPGQMFMLLAGLQHRGYKKLDFSFVGESSCADSWGRALKTGEPSLSIPCYAERRFGGVADDELLLALPPAFLPRVLDGLAALHKNGLRYPIPPWEVQADPTPSLAVSYPGRKF